MRVTELMKQKQYAPLSVAEMGLVIFAAEKGFLDDIELKKIKDFEAALLSFANIEYKELIAHINNTGDYSDEVETGLKEIIEKFKTTQSW